jgi:ribonuclease E
VPAQAAPPAAAYSAPVAVTADAVTAEAAAPAAIVEHTIIAPDPAATESMVRAESVPAAAPVHSEPTRPPAPVADIEKALEESGLVLVRTDPGKVRPAETTAASQYVPPQPRPRRTPPADTGPLQIVETRK